MATGRDGTDYRVIIRSNQDYAVEMTSIGGMSDIVEGFKTRTEAGQWIYDRMTAVQSDLPSHVAPRHSTPGVERDPKV